MKLYTEEQVKSLVHQCRIYNVPAERFLFNYTPIELPSDEEIYIEAQVKKDNIKILPFDTASFQFGALWLRDKIQGGSK